MCAARGPTARSATRSPSTRKTPWIEFRDPRRGLSVRRKADPLPAGQSYIDIRDAAPNVLPSKKGVRYSVYSDTANFMEIEAAGGCPAVIRPNTEMSVTVSTRFARTIRQVKNMEQLIGIILLTLGGFSVGQLLCPFVQGQEVVLGDLLDHAGLRGLDHHADGRRAC